MKKLATLFVTLFAFATGMAGEYTTYITNRSTEKVTVEWRTSLSSSTKSPVSRQVVPAKAQNFQASDSVDWFIPHTESSSNAMIYTVDVKVYDSTGRNLLGENSIQKTMGKNQLTGPDAKANLYITVGKKFAPSVVVK
ncbi:MAG: hypothetical protein MRY21_03335 [Simkaniaceae bacterium]|nr:hypothetical protein [Simkaniaceae bacterium]